MRRSVSLVVALLAIAPAVAAADPPAPTAYEGTANGRFFHVIPPGEAGVANATDAAAFEATKAEPAHFDDQMKQYTNLLYASPGIKDADIGTYFPDASFGVKPGDVARTYHPRDDVTIVRDNSTGTPHVYGATRAATAFGVGYASAEDRLFFMDVLRHYGAGKLASFAGGANVDTDREQFETAPYTPADIQKQLDDLPKLYGQVGQNLVDDVANYVAGVNAYIDAAKLNPLLMPVEYAAITKPLGPDPWTSADVLYTASLIGAQLGKGGGNEMTQLSLLQADIDRYGPSRGVRAWVDLRSLDDPEAPTTAFRKRGFPYDQIPKNVLGHVALPDKGSLRYVSTVAGKPDTVANRSAASGPVKGLLRFPQTDSNALLVSAKKSATGHPLTVFGSQAGYFEPEIWWGVEAHGPGFDARGANIPGTGPYVEIGRGQDYAWSATSASQDIIDVYALPTCQDDTHYRFRGRCEAMDTIEQSESWVPSVADQTAAGSVTFRVLRTKLGLVVARATIKGKPVVYTALRSTYGHEFDSGRGFQEFNDPDKIRDVHSYQRAAMGIGYTFNWLYTDDKDIGYINTGANPQRPRGVNGLLPQVYARSREWKGFNPDENIAKYQPMRKRPQAINQKYLVSWNNKQGAHCCGGTAYTPLWRSQLLSEGLDRRMAGGHKLTLSDVVDSAEDAATQDLRGVKMLPIVLKVLGTPKDPEAAAAAAKLRAWVASGAHRIDRDRNGTYEDADAVRIMDAWYATLPAAVFEARMGRTVFDRYDDDLSPDLPNSFHGSHSHLGSAWEDGWGGFIQKDLRTLATPGKVRGAWHQVYCGKGSLTKCRAAIGASLKAALAIPATTVYDDPTLKNENCGVMDAQACYDALRYRPLGLISQPMQPWQNRPTQQQVVEVTSHRGR
ncbi:MAG: hypothetical protein QOF76_5056 [Solirubrobacteraceae bacterium]|nr:hypothetical protein [Solirubrobacteraceae bacterium]